MITKLHFLLLLTGLHGLTANNCVSRDYGYGSIVCVCNANQCDTLNTIEKVDSPKYLKYTSTKAGLRFQEDTGEFEEKNNENENVISLGIQTYQEIFGFGGAFTDSTGINIKTLSDDIQEKLLKAYFDKSGIEYNIGRVPIAGTDFSTRPYSYCDTDNNKADTELKNFTLASEDQEYKIPFILKAQDLTNGSLKLFASAWIAPGWMKTDPTFTSRDSYIKDEMYQVWADYFIKFLDAYKEHKINFWGITTGNEPMTAFLPEKILVPSVAWLPEGMIKWVKENLGPTIRSSAYSDIKVLTLDDNGILLPWIVEMLFTDKEVKNYIDGIGVHWYGDFFISSNNLNETHNLYPDKFIMYTEACNGFLTNNVWLGSWDGAEHYAHNIIQDLNNWAVGWTDWNMALNMEGGPTFIKNFVDSPIIVNSTGNEFLKQPSYYTLGHFSKVLPRGSVRLESNSKINGIDVTAFKRPDNGTAVIILNTNHHDIPVTLRDNQDASFTIPAKSINSIVYW